MEFASRKQCIEHFQGQYPNLPRYMVEMALDYDLANGGSTNEKPKSGAQKRKAKRVKEAQAQRDTSFQDHIQAALKEGKPIEIDCASVVKEADYKMPPFVPGYISLDGLVDSPIAEPLNEEDEK